MPRRLFFLLPDTASAAQLVIELRRQGVDRKHIHAVAGHRDLLHGLPIAAERQAHDDIARVDRTV
jgi:hypothetical protein